MDWISQKLETDPEENDRFMIVRPLPNFPVPMQP